MHSTGGPWPWTTAQSGRRRGRARSSSRSRRRIPRRSTTRPHRTLSLPPPRPCRMCKRRTRTLFSFAEIVSYMPVLVASTLAKVLSSLALRTVQPRYIERLVASREAAQDAPRATSVKCNLGLKLTQKRNTPAEPRRRPCTYLGSFVQPRKPASRRRGAQYT